MPRTASEDEIAGRVAAATGGAELISITPTVASAARRVDPLRSQTGLSREEIIQQMISSRDHYGLEDSTVKPEEIRAAAKLVETKFATNAWFNILP